MRRSHLGPMRPRLVATFALIPIVCSVELVLYVVTTSWAWGGPSWIGNAMAAGLTFAPFVVFYFGGVLIWASTVRWTRTRARALAYTTLALLLLVATPALLYFVSPYTVSLLGSYGEFYLFASLIISLVAGSAGLVFLSWVCYDPPASRRDRRVPCPGCGYDLRGQRECRCPECGREYTLGELQATDQNDGS